MATQGSGFRSLTLFVILVFFYCLGLRHSFAQQQKPNLSGTWKLNLRDSKFSFQHKRESDTYKIKHAGPRLEVAHLFDGRSQLTTYLTDGKERFVNWSSEDGALRAKAYWDGDTLLIEKHQDLGDTTWVSRYSLSQDGKSLRITHRVIRSSFSAAFDQSLVYDKEP